MLKELNIQDLLLKIASKDPTPGGGSVAALSGAIAAGLIEMVAQLTIGKKKYSRVEDEMKKIIQQAQDLRVSLLDDMDRDADAYSRVMDAYGYPKDNDAEKKIRIEKIQNALQHAAEIPLQVAIKAKDLLELAQIVKQKGNQNAHTDAFVAESMARASITGALANVRINSDGLHDQAVVKQMEKQINIIAQVLT